MWAVILTREGISAEVLNCILWNMDFSFYHLHWICCYFGSHSLLCWKYYVRDHVKKPGLYVGSVDARICWFGNPMQAPPICKSRLQSEANHECIVGVGY